MHDRVANHEYLPVLPDLLPQCDDEEQAVKIVRLIKNDEPLVNIHSRVHTQHFVREYIVFLWLMLPDKLFTAQVFMHILVYQLSATRAVFPFSFTKILLEMLLYC